MGRNDDSLYMQQPPFGPPFGMPGQPPFGTPGERPGIPPFQPPGRRPGAPPQPPERRPGRPPIEQPPTSPGRPPTGPPPSFRPELAPYRIDPGAIRQCLYRYTYIWLDDGRQFWFYPVFLGRRSIAGYRWFGFFWIYFGTDLDNIQSFICY